MSILTAEERLALMEEFQADMKVIDLEGTERGAYRPFKNAPDTFKYVHAGHLFNVWLAGHKAGVAKNA